MMLLGGAQAAVGALLIGRMGWLAIAQNEKYQLLSRKQPRPADPGAAAARLDHRPQRQADRDQPVELPRRHHPAAAGRRAATSSPSSRKLLELPPDEVDRIHTRACSSRAASSRCQVAENVPYEQYAAVTVRLPELPGVAGDRAASPASIRTGRRSATWSAMSARPTPRNMRRRTRTRCCSFPGVKIGKEGLEKTLEPYASRQARRAARRGHRARQAGQGARPQARPQRQTVQLTIDPGPAAICGAADGRPVGRAGRHRRGERRHARLRRRCRRSIPNSFSDGIGRTEWKMLSRGRPHPAAQQGRAGPLPVGLDDQAGDGAGVPQAGIDRKQRVNCTGGYQLGNRYFHCDSGPRAGGHATRPSSTAATPISRAWACSVGAEKLTTEMVNYLGYGEKFDLPIRQPALRHHARARNG